MSGFTREQEAAIRRLIREELKQALSADDAAGGQLVLSSPSAQVVLRKEREETEKMILRACTNTAKKVIEHIDKEIDEKITPKITQVEAAVRYNNTDQTDLMDYYRRGVATQEGCVNPKLIGGGRDERHITRGVQKYFTEDD